MLLSCPCGKRVADIMVVSHPRSRNTRTRRRHGATTVHLPPKTGDFPIHERLPGSATSVARLRRVKLLAALDLNPHKGHASQAPIASPKCINGVLNAQNRIGLASRIGASCVKRSQNTAPAQIDTTPIPKGFRSSENDSAPIAMAMNPVVATATPILRTARK